MWWYARTVARAQNARPHSQMRIFSSRQIWKLIQSSADVYAMTEMISTVASACFCTCSAVDWVICSSCGIHICHGIAIARKKQKRKMQHATWKMCILDRRRVEHLHWHDSLDMNWYQHKVVRTYHTDRCTEGVRRDVGAEFWLDNTRVAVRAGYATLQVGSLSATTPHL